MNEYEKLLLQNKSWVSDKTDLDKDYFKNLADIQKPEFLWIGCSDSRVPANEITNTEPGEIFVHRNIANLVVNTDLNMLSVLKYAVEVLKVKHIIVCGHYGCGGVKAAITNHHFGLLNKWLRNIKDVYQKYVIELESILNEEKRIDRLTELNVIEQVQHLAKTKIVQTAWASGKELAVHGWVYGLNSGLVTELKAVYDDKGDIEPIYRYEFKKPV